MPGLERWHTPDERQSMRVCELAGDFDKLKTHLEADALKAAEPWNELYLWAASNLTLEATGSGVLADDRTTWRSG